MNKSEILEELYNDKWTEQVLTKLTSNHQLKEDLRQEVFLILYEMNSLKIKKAHKKKYLKYLFVTICKNQYHSSSSPFHKTYRTKYNEWGEYHSEEELEISEEDKDDYEKLIQEFLKTITLVDRELFKIYYKIGIYNKIDGVLRDKDCTSDKSTYKKIEDKLQIETISGRPLKMSKNTIRNSILETREKLKKFINK